MGKPVNSEVERVETVPLRIKVNKEVFGTFKDYLKEQGYPMNVVLETFMNQYANGKFKIEADDILKFKNTDVEVDTLSSSFNKEIYTHFKSVCKSKEYFVKYVIMAFMEEYASRNLVLEYVYKSNKSKE